MTPIVAGAIDEDAVAGQQTIDLVQLRNEAVEKRLSAAG